MNAVDLKKERLKQRITLVVIALSYLPFFILAEPPELDSDSLVRYFSSQFGYLAATFLLWQFVLGTRAISTIVHKDLVWARSLHRRLATYGIALVIAHPILIAIRYSPDLLIPSLDSLSSNFDRGVAFGRTALILFLIIWISSALLRARIGFRPWRYIHWLTYAIMPMVLLHAPKVGSFYALDSTVRAIWTGMTLIFITVVLLRVAFFLTHSQRKYKLIDKKEIADQVFMYRLKPLKHTIQPAPGQFIYLRAGFWSEEHPFSVAGYNKKSGEITVAAKVFGRYTKKMSNLEVGTEVSLDGPYGVFTQEIAIDKKRPVTFIAGGIGITPFIQHILDDKKQRITLFNSNRAPSNVVLHTLLKKKLGDRYIDVFSDKDVKGAEKGFVDIDLLKKHLGKAFDKQMFYVCGPPPMMAGLRKALNEADIPDERIYTEEFGF